jgi:hypothetical protein
MPAQRELKFLGLRSGTEIAFFEKSFESPLYSRLGFRNLSNQKLAARQD